MVGMSRKTSKAQQMLAWLKDHPGSTSSQIAKALGLDVSKVSGAMWANEKRGYVTRALDVSGIKAHVIWAVADRYAPTVTSPVKQAQPAKEAKPEHPPIPFVQMPIPQPVPATPGVQLDQVLTTFAKALASQIVAQVQDMVVSELRTTMPQIREVASVGQVAQRIAIKDKVIDDRKKVLIAGLLPMQAGLIAQDFHDVFDLRFYTTDDNFHKLADMAKHVDHVFTFTSKVPHAVENVLMAGGHKIHRCTGGLSMLKDQLLKLYAEGEV